MRGAPRRTRWLGGPRPAPVRMCTAGTAPPACPPAAVQRQPTAPVVTNRFKGRAPGWGHLGRGPQTTERAWTDPHRSRTWLSSNSSTAARSHSRSLFTRMMDSSLPLPARALAGEDAVPPCWKVQPNVPQATHHSQHPTAPPPPAPLYPRQQQPRTSVLVLHAGDDPFHPVHRPKARLPGGLGVLPHAWDIKADDGAAHLQAKRAERARRAAQQGVSRRTGYRGRIAIDQKPKKDPRPIRLLVRLKRHIKEGYFPR